MVIEDPSALAFVFVGSRIATDRLINGQTDRRTDRRKEGRTDGRKDILHRCERLGLSLCAVPSLNGTVCVFLFGRVGITERA